MSYRREAALGIRERHAMDEEEIELRPELPACWENYMQKEGGRHVVAGTQSAAGGCHAGEW